MSIEDMEKEGMASAETPDSEQLSPLTKLAFGVGELGPATVSAVNGFFLIAFLAYVGARSPVAPAAEGRIRRY